MCQVYFIADNKCLSYISFLIAGDDNYCKQNPCREGEGDCDGNRECQSGLKCGYNNCVGSQYDETDDCCVEMGIKFNNLFKAWRNLLTLLAKHYCFHLKSCVTFFYCLTKISIRAKRSISRVFSLFIVPSPFFCTLPVQRPY